MSSAIVFSPRYDEGQYSQWLKRMRPQSVFNRFFLIRED